MAAHSDGRKKGQYEYRLRWDDVKYERGELKVIAYKNGEKWAEEIIKTTGEPAGLDASADRNRIKADGKDLAFITVRVTDKEGLIVPDAMNKISFEIQGPGEIISTDNGDPTNMIPFPSHEREAFNGLALVIIRSKQGISGSIIVTVSSPWLKEAQVDVKSH